MNKEISKRILPFIALILLCIPIATSSLLDLKQKKENELILEQQKIQKNAEEKIYLMGKFNPAQREDFVAVPMEYNVGGYNMYLRKETLNAFLEMQNEAKKNEIELKIASATRNFEYQKNIWNNKWTGATLVDREDLSESIPDSLKKFKKILEYSAVPGTSRHHWGTEIDINNANTEYFNSEKGEKEYKWLRKNAYKFGFCQPYNLKGVDRPTGYNEEKWHWSYMPLSKNLLQEYKKLIKNENIKGFMGNEFVTDYDLINNYVLGINPECL